MTRVVSTILRDFHRFPMRENRVTRADVHRRRGGVRNGCFLQRPNRATGQIQLIAAPLLYAPIS